MWRELHSVFLHAMLSLLTDNCDSLSFGIGPGQKRIQPVQLLMTESSIEHCKSAEQAPTRWHTKTQSKTLKIALSCYLEKKFIHINCCHLIMQKNTIKLSNLRLIQNR